MSKTIEERPLVFPVDKEEFKKQLNELTLYQLDRKIEYLEKAIKHTNPLKRSRGGGKVDYLNLVSLLKLTRETRAHRIGVILNFT